MTAMTDTYGGQRAAQVTNGRGRVFRVRLVRTGETYGVNGGCLTNDETEPLVEFYDATYAGSDRFGPLGQFVSRYYLHTLNGTGQFSQGHVGARGLELDGGVDVWKLDASAACAAVEWAEQENTRATEGATS